MDNASRTIGGRSRRRNRHHSSPGRAINTGKFMPTLDSGKSNRDLLRPANLGPGTILRQEFPDFFPQDLISCRTQVNLIAYEQSRDRFAVLPQHVRTDVDVFRFGLRRKKLFHEPVKLQDVVQKHHARRTWFYRDERDRYGRGIGPEDCEQLPKGLVNFVRRCTDGEIVVPGVDHNGRRFAR